MAYIGNQPAESYSAFQKQDFTTSATTSYTLDNPVANANELALFINFVRQEPTTAYSASGTSLTLTSATSASDDMYCVYLGKAVQTVNPPNGSVGSSQVASTIITGQTAETSIATDDLILLSDTSASGALKKMTRANFVSGVGGTNTPAFFANLSGSSQSVSNNTWTKVNINNEIYDIGDFDASTNYRFTPTTAGKYFVFGAVLCNSGSAGNLHHAYSAIYKNGSFLRYSSIEFDNTNGEAASATLNHIVVFNGSSDYVELYGNVRTGSGSGAEFVANNSWFGAYKIIE